MGGGLSQISFCPELIDHTTAMLSEVDLRDYLTCVEVQLDYYVANHAMTDDEASEWFDRYLANTFMDSMKLMNKVQMTWLDSVA